MAQLDKLYLKVASAPANTRFEDLVRLVEAVGFVEIRERGSHRIFRHRDRPRLLLNLQPLRGKSKEYQVREVLAMIDQENLRGW